MRARALALLAAAGLSLAAPTARANGRFPTANQLVVSPAGPSTMVVRTTFGLLITRDGGASWDWICERVLDLSPQEDPAIGVTAANTVFSGEFAGLMVSPDTGCSWHPAPGALGTTTAVDLVVRKDAPHAALVLASKYLNADDAGNPTYGSQLYATADDCATFATVGPAIDPSLLVETIEIAPSDPEVVYLSAIREGVGGVLLASKDGGVTWSEHPVPLEATHERAPFIAAVDPSDPQLVYVRTSGLTVNDPTRLLVTRDGGQSFTAALTATGALQGFALSPDGAKVYVGGPVDGLRVAARSDLAFKQTNAAAISCLATVGAQLFACSNEASGFFIGTSSDDGATFTTKLHLSGIRGPLACAPGTTTAACAQDWPALADSLGIVADAGADAGSPSGSGGGSGKSCGCGVVGARGSLAVGLSAAIGALALSLRRRSRRLR